MRAVRVRISGQVQGVGYRNWTEATARACGLTGWVRNRADGSVEALFQGAAEQVQQIVADCWRGPVSAHVSHVEIEEVSIDTALAASFVRLSTV